LRLFPFQGGRTNTGNQPKNFGSPVCWGEGGKLLFARFCKLFLGFVKVFKYLNEREIYNE